MTESKAFGLKTEDQLTEIRYFAAFMRRIKRFNDSSTLETFNEIFGQENGLRLRQYYYDEKVNQDFRKFLTYLTSEQEDIFYVYISNNYSGS